jgi:hypothetical protein
MPPRSPKVMTDADFVETMGSLLPCPIEPGSCLLILAHTNLHGTEAAEDESDSFEARDFFEMVLAVAQEFQEIQIGLLNHRDAEKATGRLNVAPSASALFSEVLVCLHATEWRHITCGCDETPKSIRLWLRGVLLANGFRSTISRDDLKVRLAYELAEPANFDFGEARWDVPDFRTKLYNEAKQQLDRLAKKWALRGP